VREPRRLPLILSLRLQVTSKLQATPIFQHGSVSQRVLFLACSAHPCGCSPRSSSAPVSDVICITTKYASFQVDSASVIPRFVCTATPPAAAFPCAPATTSLTAVFSVRHGQPLLELEFVFLLLQVVRRSASPQATPRVPSPTPRLPTLCIDCLFAVSLRLMLIQSKVRALFLLKSSFPAYYQSDL
jgi:hypothetical protein